MFIEDITTINRNTYILENYYSDNVTRRNYDNLLLQKEGCHIMMNIIEAVNCFEPINFEQKKNNEQIYFQLCQSCFWCASRLYLSSEEEDRHITKCPYCNEVRLRSLPLTDKPSL